MNLVKRLFQHGVDRFKRRKGCEAQRSKAVWQHQSDAKQGALRDLTFRTEANVQAINMLMDSSSWCPNLRSSLSKVHAAGHLDPLTVDAAALGREQSPI